MKTIELTITKNKKPAEILKFLRDKNLTKGDLLTVVNKDEKNSFQAICLMVLLLLVKHFTGLSKRKESFGDNVEGLLFNKTISTDKLEKQIEKEYGVTIEIKQQDNETKMWKELSIKNFLKGYDDKEPEYTLSDVKEPNPVYKKWKKAK